MFPKNDAPTLYEKIGPAFIDEAITEFYRRAFLDPIIGHFFFNKDRQELTRKQIAFSSRMLGAKDIVYQGRPLKAAHSELPLRDVHFRRRQVLMRDVLVEKGLAPELEEAWLGLEENLKSLIVNAPSC